MAFRTLDGVAVAGKRVLLRADLNVPVRDGKITDLTRLERLCPTIRELSAAGARVIVCSHFDRPKGKRVASMSLAPVAAALGQVLGRTVSFAEDCIGLPAQQAVERLGAGDVLVLENTRFYPGEEKNDPAFAADLAKLADLYVNDAFSAAHRAHASTEGVAKLLPAYAGRLMQAELEALELALSHPTRPVAAIVGGAKVSTKLDLLGNLVGKVDMLVIGGAMANTFLAAEGLGVGKSLQEAEMHATARDILAMAKAANCEVAAAGGRGPGRRTRAQSADQDRAGAGGARRHDDPRCRPGHGGEAERAPGGLEDAGVERPPRRLRDAAVRCRHHGARPGGGGANPRWRAEERGRRRRHRLRLAACRRAGGVQLCLHRRWRLP